MIVNHELTNRMRRLRYSAHNYYRTIEEQQDAGWIVAMCSAIGVIIIGLGLAFGR